MELGENNFVNEGLGKVISTFDFSKENEEVKEGNSIGEMIQGEFSFTDGIEENIGNNYVEEIEMLRDEEVISEKTLAMKEDKESAVSQKFKEYIILCRELELIPSWADFERYKGNLKS
ncbi:hypothetical protein [Clostridium sp.]|uniref:hypothetical protein n=1 Tax=Clostridium sp. TaxID=1506 RepID=UPI00284AB668|nr:hypothetical protein [Clostridium sp.]MDR3596633.1 hypothetical protein [Clostridium sp.]